MLHVVILASLLLALPAYAQQPQRGPYGPNPYPSAQTQILPVAPASPSWGVPSPSITIQGPTGGSQIFGLSGVVICQSYGNATYCF